MITWQLHSFISIIPYLVSHFFTQFTHPLIQTCNVPWNVVICCSYSSANAYMLMYRQIDPARNKRKYPASYGVSEKVLSLLWSQLFILSDKHTRHCCAGSNSVLLTVLAVLQTLFSVNELLHCALCLAYCFATFVPRNPCVLCKLSTSNAAIFVVRNSFLWLRQQRVAELYVLWLSIQLSIS